MRAFLALIICLLAVPSLAQERVLSAERAAGFDTVITQCVSFTRAAFANEMCDDLLMRADPMIRAEGLTHIALGRTEWGFGSDVYLAPPDEADLERSVHLTIYLRGSDDPPSLALWMSLYTITPSGRLEIWEDSGMGAGDPNYIANALSKGLAQKLAPVLTALGAGKPD